MNDKKEGKLKIALVLFVLSIFILFLRMGRNEAPIVVGSESLILFYGDTCPHCKIVEEYLDKEKIDEKLTIDRKEVYRDKANSLELASKAEYCGLPVDTIGVPFLFDGERCYVGDKDIIEIIKTKL